MIEHTQKLILQLLGDTPTRRAKLYGLALLRSIRVPRTVSQSLGLKNKNTYTQAFRSLYQDYDFAFTDASHQYLQEEIRVFLRNHLLARRTESEIYKIIRHIYENQQKRLYKLEEIYAYQDLRTRLNDEEWIEAFLDMIEAQFWVDPSMGVTYAISLFLAANLYQPHFVHEVVSIGSFFADEMISPHRDWWSKICQSFNLFESPLRLYEKIEALNDMKYQITHRKLRLPALFTAFSQQLIAALWWQEGELYRDAKPHEALACYSKALPLLYPEEQVTTALAQLYWIMVERATDPELQIEFLNKVIEYQPDFVDAYCELGDTYFNQENYPLALTYYHYTIEIKLHHVNAWINLGVIHTKLKNYQRALDELNYAEDLGSTHPLLYFNRANVYRELRKHIEALKDFDKAIELDPTYAHAYTNRGNIYAALNKPERASQDYERALKLQPDDMQALWLQEWIHFGKQRVPSTIARRLQEIAAREPGHYLAAVCTGLANGLTQKHIRQALPELERGCLEAPDQWDAYFWLAMLAAYCNRTKQAAIALDKAVELGLPAALFLPLYWLERDRPPFFQRYAQPLLQKYAL